MPRWVWKEVPDISFFAEWGYFHRFALRVPAWIRIQAEIMGHGLSLCPMAVVIYRDRPGIAWLPFKYWIGLENHLWGLREEGGGQKWNKKFEMSLPLLICAIAPLSVILLLQWHFVRIGMGPAVTIEWNHFQRSHPERSIFISGY